MISLNTHFENFLSTLAADVDLEARAANIIKSTSLLPAHFSYFLGGVEFDVESEIPELDYFISLSNSGDLSREVASACCQELYKNNSGLSSGNIPGAIKSLYDDYPAIHNLENIWFEFDNDNNYISLPSLFFSLSGKNSGIFQNDFFDPGTMEFISDIDNLFGSSLSNGFARSGIFEEFCHKFCLASLGLMLRRKSAGRYFYTHARLGELANLVKTFNCKLSDNLSNIIPQLNLIFDYFDFQIDSSPEYPAEIGIECYIYPANNYFYTRKMEIMKSWLRENRNCKNLGLIPDKINKSNIRNSFELEIKDNLLRPVCLKSGFHHLKLSVTEEGINKIKAYLWLENDWERT